MNETLIVMRCFCKSRTVSKHPPDVAITLNNLAVLYKHAQRLGEAGHSYTEALGIYRGLAEAKPDEFLPYIATTLNNLAVLY